MSNRERILVIDDDPLFRSLIVTLLRKDYFVSVANDGSDGFYKALEHPPSLAVVDIKMPGWDGLKTLKAFRSHPSLNRVKVVILTSDASKETVLAAIHGGANDYIIKAAFSKEEFLSKLQKLLPAPAKTTSDASSSTDASKDREGNAKTPSANTSSPKRPKARRSAKAKATAGKTSKLSPAPSSDDETAAIQEVMDSWE